MSESETRGRSRVQRLAWLPIPILGVAMAVLWAADARTSHESAGLLTALIFLFSTLASTVVAYLVGRSFLARGAPGVLMLGCGVVLWGASGIVAQVAGLMGVTAESFANVTITIHNTCVWLSALCHLVGVLLSVRTRPAMRAVDLGLTLAYAGALGAAGLVTMVALAGWMPVFFVQGEGGTPVRTFVLGSSIAMFTVTAILLRLPNRKLRTPFTYWYSLALALIAVGLFGVMIQSTQGSVLGWTGRAAQYLSGVYMVIAASVCLRESGSWSITLEDALRESEARTAAILESIGDAFIAFDTAWRFVYINAAAQRTVYGRVGREREDLIGRKLWEEFPALIDTPVHENYHKAMNERVPVSFETYYPPLGTWYWIRVYPYGDGISAYCEDITERKQAEEALVSANEQLQVRAEQIATANEQLAAANEGLHTANDELRVLNDELRNEIAGRKRVEQELVEAREESEQRAAELQSLVSSMADGVSLADLDGNVLWTNDALREILGMPPDEAFEDWASRFQRFTLAGEPLPLEQAVVYRALRGDTVRDYRYKVVTPWGKCAIVSVSASPVRDSRGTIIGAASVTRDVTDLAEFERQREELYHREHHIAEMLQQALIPVQIPTTVSGCHFAAKYVPASAEAQVGGDFYDVFELGDNRVGVLIGDVAGKGLRAAMQVSAARHAFRSYAYVEPSPSRVTSLVNDAMCKDEGGDAHLLTAFFAVVDTQSRAVSYTNAGHEPPAIRRACGSVGELNVGSRALGFLPDCDYPEETLTLDPGDVIVLVTDGITEARSESFGMFGKSEMLRFLAEEDSPPSELVDRLLEKAKQFGGGCLQDDVAIVALELDTSCMEAGLSG